MSAEAYVDGARPGTSWRPGDAEGSLEGEPRVSVVVPALDEAKNIPWVLERLDPEVHELIVVVADMQDNTIEAVRRVWPGAHIVEQVRRGKGNALACGFAACSGDVIVMLDADGSCDPAEMPRFIDALVGGADFAKGSRCIMGGGSSDLTLIRRCGNRILSSLVNRLYGTRHTDLCYGYNAFWRDVLPFLKLDPGTPGPKRLRGDGFEVETLIHVRVAMSRLRTVEVPSVERCRRSGTSNLHATRDGLRVLHTIGAERWRMGPRPLARRAGLVPSPSSGRRRRIEAARGVKV